MNQFRYLMFAALSVCIICCVSSQTYAETASEAYDRGQSLMEKGDFEAAMNAFSAAAMDDFENEQYLRAFVSTRNVVALLGRLEQETDLAKWVNIARALHQHY